MTRQTIDEEVVANGESESVDIDAPVVMSRFGMPLWMAIGIFLGLFGQVAFFAGFQPDRISPYLRMLLHAAPVLVILFSDNEFGRQFKPGIARFMRGIARFWYVMICVLALIAGGAGWHPWGWPVYAGLMAWGLVACWRVG
ncbi:MAG TPA: hypothetical protein VGM23_17580 [Armatimonadota bacterium]|jgi:hypothetical protein